MGEFIVSKVLPYFVLPLPFLPALLLSGPLYGNCSGSLFPRRSCDLARLRWSGWQGYRRTGECKADGVDGADGSASTCFHG